MAKSVSTSKFTELKGLDRISTITHEMKCLFRIISQDDVGIDGEIEVLVAKPDGKGFEAAGGIVKVQAKSGVSYVKKDNESTFATPVKEDDLTYWNRCTFPVLFIVYHPESDKLYYKEIKTYIKETNNVWQRPYEIVFNKATDEFSANASRNVSDHAAASPQRIDFNVKERLFSNLLPFKRVPNTVATAKATCATFKELKADAQGYTPPFCIEEGRLFTFSDLENDRNVLRNYCEQKTISTVPFDEMCNDISTRNHLVFMFNQLFGSHCHHLGLAYNRDFKRTYFPREEGKEDENCFSRTWKSSRTNRDAPARAVAQHYEYGALTFWRHLAAEFHFINTGNIWFLEIQPKYLFTTDGKTPCDPSMVGPYTTRLKALEHNPQVLNHVLFWAHTLARGSRTIEMKLFGESVVTIDSKPLEFLSDFGLPLDPATFEETDPSKPIQMSLIGFDELDIEMGYAVDEH